MDVAAENKKNPAVILEKLGEYFKPKRNVTYERFTFNMAKQAENESFEEFLNRIRRLVSSCDYKALTDEMIRDKLVIGTKDNDARACMLRDSELTLAKAIENCRVSEITQVQIKNILPSEQSVNFVKTRKWPKCGGEHSKDKCPAEGEDCFKCGKANHFQKMCRTPKHRPKKAEKDRDKGYKKKFKKNKQKVNKVSDSESSDESSEEHSSSESSAFQIEHSVGALGKQIFIKVHIHSVSLKMQMDTGATCKGLGKMM